METRTLEGILTNLGACTDAIDWAESRDDFEAAWNACERGDWLLWIAAKLGIRRQDVTKAACKCARTALKYVKPGEDRPLKAIETIEAWTCGNATIDQVREARHNAADVCYAAIHGDNPFANSSISAASAYASEDDANYATANYVANYAAAAAYYAGYAIALAAAYTNFSSIDATIVQNTLKHCADLVRQTITFEDIEKLIPKS